MALASFGSYSMRELSLSGYPHSQILSPRYSIESNLGTKRNKNSEKINGGRNGQIRLSEVMYLNSRTSYSTICITSIPRANLVERLSRVRAESRTEYKPKLKIGKFESPRIVKPIPFPEFKFDHKTQLGQKKFNQQKTIEPKVYCRRGLDLLLDITHQPQS